MDAIRFVPRQPATRVEGFGTAKSALRLDRPPSTRVRERLSTGLVEGEESNPEGRPNVWTALHARRGQLPRLPTFREHALETSERTEEDPGDHQANRGEGEGTATGCGPREETGRQPVCALEEHRKGASPSLLLDNLLDILSVANIHPRPGSTAPPCPSNLVIPLHGRLVSVMQASEPRPRHSSAAWNLGYCRAAAGGGFLC